MAFVSLQNGLAVQASKSLHGESVLFVQGLSTKISFDDLCAMTLYALTSVPLQDGDPRLEFVETVRQISYIVDEAGKRFELPKRG